MRKILITGANGFVGNAVLEQLSSVNSAYALLASVRAKPSVMVSGVNYIEVPSLKVDTPWLDALEGVDAVIHCAARVHIMNDASSDPLCEFRKINVAGTLSLARQAVAAGVRRFIFVSSIKVNGEATRLGRAFVENDYPQPIDAYGVSKFEAETELMVLAKETGLEVVIIRPPLVYGPGVKANFASMMKWLQRGIPLPLGAIKNKRSFVALDNLVDLIVTCIHHPAAVNQVFLAGDGHDLSTTELLQSMAKALNVPARLIPVPMSLINLGAAALNKRDVAQRLCGSLQTDISKARNLLGWEPPVSVDEALLKTARYFLDQNQ
jgi:nucleoside-diphosphate-sugar epimerase